MRSRLVIGIVALVVAACSGSTSATSAGPAPTATSSSASSAAPSAEPEVEVAAPVPATTASLPASSGQICGDLKAHVYNPDRLQLLAACVTVTGTVAVIRSESDGDLHVLLQLDPGEEKYLNAKNISGELGDLVLEPVCVRSPTQADAIPACAGYSNPLAIPAVGSHVSVTGAWVLDLDHGWQELHPVFAFNGVGAPPTAAPTSPPATATPAPPPPTTAPVATLCGAAANPWNYTFCGGNLITSPAAGFCSYFGCISSFATGTGYVVQCVDGRFSKSGGHTGVCSQHGGFGRNLYSP